MAVTRIRRGRNSGPTLTADQVQHLVEGWVLDVCEPWFRKLGFPFENEEHRKALWFAHRGSLVSRWGPVEHMAAWRDYEATAEQRAAFDVSKMPRTWEPEVAR